MKMYQFFTQRVLTLFLAFCFGIFLYSCNEDTELILSEMDSSPSISVKNGRLVFKNNIEFRHFIGELSENSAPPLKKTEEKSDFISLHNYLSTIKDSSLIDTTTLKNVIPIYHNVLNRNFELQVNDTIFWFHGNYEYIVLNNQETLLADIKLNPIKYLEITNPNLIVKKIMQVSIIKPIEPQNQLKSLCPDCVWDADSYQKQFTPAGSGIEYKYVFEIVVWDYHYLATCIENRIKFEYWHKRKPDWRSGWDQAGEMVDKYMYNSYLTYKSGTYQTVWNFSTNLISSNSDLIMGRYNFPSPCTYIKVTGNWYAKARIYSESFNKSGTLWENNF